jgi:hypothetical protein
MTYQYFKFEPFWEVETIPSYTESCIIEELFDARLTLNIINAKVSLVEIKNYVTGTHNLVSK